MSADTSNYMPRIWRFAALAGAVLLAGCDAATAGGGSAVGDGGPFAPTTGAEGGQAVHTIMDPMAGGGMAAADITPPPGWKIQSAVRWDNVNGQCSVAMVSPMFRMISPDGRSSIEQFPGFLVTTSERDIRQRGSSPGDFCMIGMADSGEALAQRFAIPFLRPQSRPQGMRQVPLPPTIEKLLPMIQRLRGAGIPVSPYAVEVTLVNPDGTMERVTLGGMVNAGQQMMPGVPPLVLNQNFVAYSVRAPAELMAQTEAMAARVFATARNRPDWERLVTAHTNRMTKPTFAQPGRGGGGVGGTGGGGTGSGGTGSGGGTIDSGTGGVWNGGRTPGDPGLGVNSDKGRRDHIDTIKEQQRCPLSDGTVVVQSIHVPCPE